MAPRKKAAAVVAESPPLSPSPSSSPSSFPSFSFDHLLIDSQQRFREMIEQATNTHVPQNNSNKSNKRGGKKKNKEEIEKEQEEEADAVISDPTPSSSPSPSAASSSSFSFMSLFSKLSSTTAPASSRPSPPSNLFTKNSKGIYSISADVLPDLLTAAPSSRPKAHFSHPLLSTTSAPAASSSSLENIDAFVTLPGLNGRVRSLSGKEERAAEKAAEKDTAGAKWFNLPAPVLTTELKQDLRLLRHRNYLDPKHFMKRSGIKKGDPLPKYFHVGRVVEGAADFYSSRLTNAERKQTFAESIKSDAKTSGYLKRKFNEVQAKTAQTERSKKYSSQARGMRKANRKVKN